MNDDSSIYPLHFSSASTQESRGPLHSGAIFEGYQKSGRNSYSVQVKLFSVDFNSGRINGSMKINNLTDQLKVLITYFEGEIVGSSSDMSSGREGAANSTISSREASSSSNDYSSETRRGSRSEEDGRGGMECSVLGKEQEDPFDEEEKSYGFVTGQYGATYHDDMNHWSRFQHFRSLKKELQGPRMTYSNSNKSQIYMRWKEKSIIFPELGSGVHGASFAGFYYLCLEYQDETTIFKNDSLFDSRPISPTRFRNPITSSRNQRRRNSTNDTTSPSMIRTSSSTSSTSSSSSSSASSSSNHSNEEEELTTFPNSIPIPPHRNRTRRFSNSSISYAEVLVSPTLLNLSLAPSSTSTPGTSMDSNSKEQESTPSSPSAIEIPLPSGTTIDEFPVPSSPPSSSSFINSRRSGTTSEERWNRSERERERERGRDTFVGSNYREKEKLKEEDYGMGSFVGAKLTG